MMSHMEEGHDEIGLLREDQQTPPPKAPAGAFGLCGCFSVDFYRPYFDVDTSEVLARIRGALFFWQTPFLELIAGGRSDAYGPFWIATTLVFAVSVTSHLEALLHFSGEVFEYDFKAVTFSAGVVYSYLAATSVLLWLALVYALKIPSRLIDVACVVGYSMVAYLPAALLAVVPYMRWPAILAAGAASFLFSLKTFAPIVQDHQHKLAFFGAHGLCTFLFVLSLGFVYV